MNNPGSADEIHRLLHLPDSVVPVHYELVVQANMQASGHDEPLADAGQFRGRLMIHILVKQATNQIVLNAAQLDITSAQLCNQDGRLLIGSVIRDDENERAVITFDEEANAGDWKLDIVFQGTLNKTVYTDDAGKQHVILSTWSGSIAARRNFPCFDEPKFKATFSITLLVPKDVIVLSNAVLERETTVLGTDLKTVSFRQTPRLSTYLVSFVIGEFESTESAVVNGMELRVYHVPGKSEIGALALSAAQRCLAWQHRYFGLAKPDEKLDLIAIPDFAPGAMDCFGCATFNESALLLDPNTAADGERERVAEVVARESSRMWLGNVVSTRWWDELRLRNDRSDS